MAQVTGAFSTVQAKGNREDLADVIYDISPTDTPFQSMVGRTSATATYHEWQTDALAAAVTTNAQIEGDAVTRVTSAPTVRIGNYCQIFMKNASVTGTQEKVKKAGRSREMAYQMAKRSKEVKRDLEATVTGVQGQNAGSDSVARQLRAYGSWITTNDSRGATGADATAATAAPTDGTQRAFTEALLKAVIKQCYDSGGEPSIVMVGSFNKQAASAFTGRAQAQSIIPITSVGAAASLYASDFGDFKIVPNRFQRAREALVIDPEMIALAWLRPWFTYDLAKVGDAETKVITGEVTLEMRNEASCGIVADLNTA